MVHSNSKRAAPISKSRPSNKRRIVKHSSASNDLITFAPIPDDAIIAYDDIIDVCIEFDAQEFIRSKTDLLITDIMKAAFIELQSKAPYKLLLHGACGVGKTMTLLFVGHMAKKSGCIVFPIQAKQFVDQEIPLSEIVYRFIYSLIDAVGEDLLSKILCKISKFSNLLELAKDGLHEEENIITCFRSIVRELQLVTAVPVVFLIDQCNAFYTKHTIQIFTGEERIVVEPGSGINPIASVFVNWNTFALKRGCILYAFSSSFNLMPTASDGNSNLFKTLHPMNESEFKRLAELHINNGRIPSEMLEVETFQQLYELCAGIPRELLAFSLSTEDCEKPTFAHAKLLYMHNRRRYYNYRIKRLFNKEKMGNELVNGSLKFAARIFVGRPMENVPEIWIEAGLITFTNASYHFLCPAASDALLTSIDKDVMRDAVSIFTSDVNTRWRALELCVVYVFRQAIISCDPIVLQCTTLDGEMSTSLFLKVKNIVHSDRVPPVASLPPGTMFVCPVGTPVIDFFIHDNDGQKVALQVSESPYINHRSKYPDFNRIKEEYQNAVVNGNTSDIHYVYLTTSSQRMLTTGKHYNEHVLLLSNIDNAASLFLKKLI